MINKNSNIIFVGPLPAPVGGVATHISGLLDHLLHVQSKCVVLDAYPDEMKCVGVGFKHIIFSGRFRFIKILLALCFMKIGHNDIIHLHFSKIVGNFLVFLFLIKRGRSLFVTLHNGDQHSHYWQSSWLLRATCRLTLNKMDKVVALSNSQRMFYRSIGVSASKIEFFDKAIIPEMKLNNALLPKEIQELQYDPTRSIFITSGYPNISYGYDDSIDLMGKLAIKFKCLLIICLYGKAEDEAYEKKLRLKCRDDKNIILINSLSGPGFASLLSVGHIYLRPSSIDSFGLAISEALNLGLGCIASDVCERDSRCVTFPVGNRNIFLEKTTAMIEKGFNKNVNINFEENRHYHSKIVNFYQVH